VKAALPPSLLMPQNTVVAAHHEKVCCLGGAPHKSDLHHCVHRAAHFQEAAFLVQALTCLCPWCPLKPHCRPTYLVRSLPEFQALLETEFQLLPPPNPHAAIEPSNAA